MYKTKIVCTNPYERREFYVVETVDVIKNKVHNFALGYEHAPMFLNAFDATSGQTYDVLFINPNCFATVEINAISQD